MTEMKGEYYNSETLVTQNPEYCVASPYLIKSRINTYRGDE